MNKQLKKLTLLFLLVVSAVLLSACQKHDGPPAQEETPPPEAHNGIYVSDYGMFSFDGDLTSIACYIGPELADASGLPEGISKGSYAFLIDNPKGLYRYDRASIFRLHIDGTSYEFRMPVGGTTFYQIVLYADGVNGGNEILFTRDADAIFPEEDSAKTQGHPAHSGTSADPTPASGTPAPTEPAPASSTPAPAEPTPASGTPAPAEPAPASGTPAPAEPTPASGTPTEPEPASGTPAPTEPAPQVPAQPDYAAIAEQFSTTSHAAATDFEWLLDIALFDGSSSGQVVTDPAQRKQITSEQALLNGGWKAFLCTEKGVYGSDVERYFNAEIQTSGDSFVIKTNWKYLFDPSAGGTIEESGSDTFEGTYDASAGTSTAMSSYARIDFDGFFISNDEKTEYAIGTFYWISGEIDRIGLMRTAE